MGCLTSARFTMYAEVLRWDGTPNTGDTDDTTQGTWETKQDPVTFEIINVWVPGTVDENEQPVQATREIRCLARSVVGRGTNLGGSAERFGEIYQDIEVVRLWTPKKIDLKKNDRVTNIRSSKDGPILWISDITGAPTVFNVTGTVPLFDAFNNHIENYALLEKA